MPSSLLLPLAAGNSFGEALVVFLGLLVYVVPALLRAAKERREKAGKPTPGRQPGRRGPRGGGMFTGESSAPERPGRKAQTAKDIWRELLEGRAPDVPQGPPPSPQRERIPQVPPQSATQPAARALRPSGKLPAPANLPSDVLSDEGDLVEIGHTIEQLDRKLDQQHANLERTHEGLPSESKRSALVSPRLALLPSEDSLERELSGRAPLRPRPPASVRRVSAASIARSPRAWRRAVVLSEILAPPIALRTPAEAPGHLPR